MIPVAPQTVGVAEPMASTACAVRSAVLAPIHGARDPHDLHGSTEAQKPRPAISAIAEAP